MCLCNLVRLPSSKVTCLCYLLRFEIDGFALSMRKDDGDCVFLVSYVSSLGGVVYLSRFTADEIKSSFKTFNRVVESGVDWRVALLNVFFKDSYESVHGFDYDLSRYFSVMEVWIDYYNTCTSYIDEELGGVVALEEKQSDLVLVTLEYMEVEKLKRLLGKARCALKKKIECMEVEPGCRASQYRVKESQEFIAEFTDRRSGFSSEHSRYFKNNQHISSSSIEIIVRLSHQPHHLYLYFLATSESLALGIVLVVVSTCLFLQLCNRAPLTTRSSVRMFLIYCVLMAFGTLFLVGYLMEPLLLQLLARLC